VEIKGAYGMTGGEYDLALEWLARKWVPAELIITREVPLDEIKGAFNLLEGPNEEVKILVRIGE
jgi:threonine dehydrogenase-like Zn-dependent dehydrogenase